MIRRRIRDSDAGETLVELILAIAILGVVVIAIGSGIALSVLVSNQHREQSTADDFLHNYAETLQPLYTACAGATAPNYVSIASLPTPAGFGAPTASVKFWDPNSQTFSLTACPGTDPGLQQVTLNLVSSDTRARESIVVILRSTS